MIVPGVHCLVFHPEHAWVTGMVEDFDGKVGVVSVSHPKRETLSKVKEDDIYVCDEKVMEEDVHDLLNLSVLHDGTLLNCLRRRYMKDVVYTNIGAIVVALNPFNFKIPWYMDAKMPEYLAEGEVIQNNLPHSWAVAHNTYYEMRVDDGNQCILVSGESGAGKTEASKIVMKYLGAVSSLCGQEEEKKAGQLMCTRMMQSNPILEAFGNAKTVRNDNSSRFGKLMKIKFNGNGVLTGADITKYLLEKSRIITSAQDERVYHSFYLLLKGRDRDGLGLEHVSAYRSVIQGKCTDVAGMDDSEEYDIVIDAMKICEFSDSDRVGIWNTVASILTLQRLDYIAEGDDESSFDPASEHFVDAYAELMSVDVAELKKELLTTTLEVQKQLYQMKLNKAKALDARDSLCKAVYDNLFSWIVAAVNKTMDSEICDAWIALLDIFGFEDFKTNSFEQLCINLTNETLQNHYNHYIFTRDMEECRLEGIDTTEIIFPDNKPTLDMISGKGGILSILDEDCLLGKATDLSFLDKICDKFGKHPSFERPKLAKIPSFRVVHYAGTVTYDVENFLDKNRDTLKNAFKLILRSSKNSLIATLLPEPLTDGTKFTVGGFFKTQLKELMDLINTTNPHWIRCIKPDPAKKPLRFNGVMTLTQLRSSGVLGTVQIRKAGYPVRLKLADFVRKYKIIATGIEGVDFNNPTAATKAIFKNAGFSSQMAQTGKTRAFLKSEAYQQLEILKKQKLQVFANVALMASMVAGARHRTAACIRIKQIETIQAYCKSYRSQVVFREKDYEARKDIIFEQVRALLKFQGDEDIHRKGVEQEQDEAIQELLEREREGLRALEAKWWAGKPARDEVAQRLLVDDEHEERTRIIGLYQDKLMDFMTRYEDDFNDALQLQEEREEEERQIELGRLAAEEERLRIEEEDRLEQERLQAIAKREHLRKLSIYHWHRNAKDMADKKKRKEQQDMAKSKQLTEAMASVELNSQLLRSERVLVAREKGSYPAPRFRHDTKEYVVDVGTPQKLEKTPVRKDPNASPSSPNRTIRGIGGLNPQWVNPAEDKIRAFRDRLIPDGAGSLQMIEKMRRLQKVRDPVVLRAPLLRADDVRNPMNPSSPDWNPPAGDVLVLPDGSQIKITDDMEIPLDEGQSRRNRTRGVTMRMMQREDFFSGDTQ